LEVITISPRGYCYGVVDAMVLARTIAADPQASRPIHVLGMLVHNRQVTEAYEALGVICLDREDATRLDLLEGIDEGTVVLTAHGVSPEVRLRALAKGLTLVDATCPDVTRTHELIAAHVAEGGWVLYVGKRGHPEPEGACGVAPGRVTLVSHENEIAALAESEGPLLVTNQTTMSAWDIEPVIAAITERFPSAVVHTEICTATQVRQEAVATQAKDADLLIVVGDPRSNNSMRLVDVGQRIAGVRSVQVASVEEVDPKILPIDGCVAVTSGASTPTAVTQEVINYLRRYDGSPPPVSAAVGGRVLPNLRNRRVTAD
jgi:4-hydroxy-3-methylbut-2-en-1-yl diphosphate reductase